MKLSMSLVVSALVSLPLGCSMSVPTSALGRGAVATTGPDEQIEGERDFVTTTSQPVSTFGADVDTGSYTYARKLLLQGSRPLAADIRPEEFLNFFDYSLPVPEGTEAFRVTVDGAPAPFGRGLHLLRVAIKGREVESAARLPANLVFLVDVSGSMADGDKLPLVKSSLHKLVARMTADDRLSLVVYAGAAGTVLEPMPGTPENRQRLDEAIERLGAGGSTAGEAGIRGAYALAARARIEGGINRVVLCTDGDFNVGATGEELIKLIEQSRDTGITLTTLGFGSGNYNDSQMEQLADKGDGFYAYVDSEKEADRLFGEALLGTLQVIAKDLKVQVRFNSDAVVRYRLIGYDNRQLAAQDFADDHKDAGDLGAGHRVVALYEIELTSGALPSSLAEVALRFKEPDGAVSTERLVDFPSSAVVNSTAEAVDDFRFAAAVVEFAEVLRKSRHSTSTLEEVKALAAGATGDRPERLELVQLIDLAKAN